MSKPILSLAVVVRFHRSVVLDDGMFLRAMGFKIIGDNMAVAKESAKSAKATFQWMLTSDATFWTFRVTGERRGWARPLKWLYRITQQCYEFEIKKNLTAGGLLGELKGARESVTDSAVIRDLRRTLSECPDSTVIDSRFLQERVFFSSKRVGPYSP